MSLVCHVSFRVVPGTEETFKAAAVDVMRLTNEEPGSIIFQFAQDLQDASVFHVTEVWADETALTDHMAQEYVSRCQAIMGPIITVIGMTQKQGPLEDVPSSSQ